MIRLDGYTQKAIEKAMLSQVPDTIDTREGSIIQAAVGPVAWYLEGMYLILAQLQENSFADTAVGQALDYKCAERGITRKAAVAAVRKGTFNIPLSEGTVFKTVNGTNSVLFVSSSLLGEENGEYVYEMTCQTPGRIGNSYTGNLLPVTAVAGLTRAVIGAVIISGSEEEDDPSLRSRYFASFEASVFGGNIAAYRSAVLAIEGVGAVQVYPVWDGGGTVLCSILTSEYGPAEPELISQVQQIICPSEDGSTEPSEKGYGMAPIGARATITTASVQMVNVQCRIQFAGGEEAAAAYQVQIEEKIDEYLETVRKAWGAQLKSRKVEYSSAVYVSRIIAAIFEIPEIINITDVRINGMQEDLILTENASLQQIPMLGEVVINGS